MSSKTSLLVLEQEKDTNISKFRKRNKILITIFLSLIISLTLIIAALISHLMHIYHTSNDPFYNNPLMFPTNPAIRTYYIPACGAYYPSVVCRTTLNSIIGTKLISDPNQIFTLSLQAAYEHLHNLTSLISGDSTFTNCSNAVSHARGRINDMLEIMRVNPFFESLRNEQRSQMMSWIMEVEENLALCADDLEKESTDVIEAKAKVSEVQVYVTSSGNFLISYKEVMQEFSSSESVGVRWRMDVELAFGLCLGGSQILFVFFMFWSLFRTR